MSRQLKIILEQNIDRQLKIILEQNIEINQLIDQSSNLSTTLDVPLR